jgi:type I restriction enzyme M protein
MSEEDVKIQFLLPYLRERGYLQDCMDFEVGVEVQEGRKKKTIFADVLVFSSRTKKAPLLLCETKSPNEPINKDVREQAISYARLLPQIAPLVLITNGAQTQVFHTLDKTRLSELPLRSDLDEDLVKFVLSADTQEALRREAKHELFIIDDVQTFKNILKSCHNEIRNNEGLDPTAAFDEMSKVMFCKLYEEKENPKGNRFRLSVFDDCMERMKFNVVSKIFDDAKRHPSYKDLFSDESYIKLKDRTIRKIVQLFENYDLGLTAFDVKGEAFEYFLGDTFTGGLGEYFTPRNVVEFMVEAMDPKIGDRIIDPFCGTGGFLIYAFETVSDKIRLQEFSDEEKKRWRNELSSRSLFGTDWKERTSQACKMNMMVHGDGSSGVFKHDGFIDIDGKIEEGAFDLCLTNPPFGALENDPETLKRFELGQGRRSQDRVILAVERCLRLTKPGGWISIIMIDGVLNNDSTQYVRDYIRHNAWIRGVVSLARETFEGYGARAKTSVLFLEKKKSAADDSQEEVFLAVAGNTGLAPNGAQMPGNVLPDILVDFKNFRKKRSTSVHFPEARVCELSDRLDAEFYLRERPADVDVVSVRKKVGTLIEDTAQGFERLRDAESTLQKMPTSPALISSLLEEIHDAAKITPDKTYRLMGVRWWGEGAFVREEKLGKNLKGTIYRVSPGCLIYNRLFAFKGSFAVLGEEQEDCYVSNEFPLFKARNEVVNGDLVVRYVVHCLNSPQYLAVVDAGSTGSTKTSRNRFNQRQLLNMVIQIPTDHKDLSQAIDLLDEATRLRKNQQHTLDAVKNLWSGLYQALPEPGPSSYAPKTAQGPASKTISLHPLTASDALKAAMKIPSPTKKKLTKKKK